MGELVNKIVKDLRGKALLIEHDIPFVIFKTQHSFDFETNVDKRLEIDGRELASDLLLDTWTYRS